MLAEPYGNFKALVRERVAPLARAEDLLVAEPIPLKLAARTSASRAQRTVRALLARARERFAVSAPHVAVGR